MINFNQNNALIGGTIAFLIASSCCWLPVVLIAFGGASSWVALSEGFGQYSTLFMLVGFALFAYGGYLFWKKKQATILENEVVLDSVITCPECGFESKEIMPTNACQFFYECNNCKKILKPKRGDCCIYCSFGTVPCPPIQLGQNCC